MSNVEKGQTIPAEDWHLDALSERLQLAQSNVNLGTVASLGLTIIGPILLKRGVDISIYQDGLPFYEGVCTLTAGVLAVYRGVETARYTIPQFIEYRRVLRTIKKRNLPTTGLLFNKRLKK